MIDLLDRVSFGANRVAEWLLAPILAFLAGLLVISVFSRYVFHIAMVDAVELTRIAFVWGCFLGAAVALRRGAHVRVTFLADRLQERWRPLGILMANAAFLVFACLMVWHGFALADRMRVTTLPTLGIAQTWLYAALPVSGALMVLHATAGLARAGADLRRGLMGARP
ncbi:TRAP transporter small permease [Salinarimonas ramus]|uniref:TRAP transporter small permease protein n=1 Tax=Salinarimonas ramus TaxID=690164 RepID=A0A917V2A8_9HYPH|nr:TRAP transporter small permease [Salinarimonas ramus]GGK21094.1 C4-dicarboxylate ABC transporter permease [Salinarimonas ramus]